jgi:hypothetical protein
MKCEILGIFPSLKQFINSDNKCEKLISWVTFLHWNFNLRIILMVYKWKIRDPFNAQVKVWITKEEKLSYLTRKKNSSNVREQWKQIPPVASLVWNGFQQLPQ